MLNRTSTSYRYQQLNLNSPRLTYVPTLATKLRNFKLSIYTRRSKRFRLLNFSIKK